MLRGGRRIRAISSCCLLPAHRPRSNSHLARNHPAAAAASRPLAISPVDAAARAAAAVKQADRASVWAQHRCQGALAPAATATARCRGEAQQANDRAFLQRLIVFPQFSQLDLLLN
jgi:hypothetical protein